jgi:hypothetical protein
MRIARLAALCLVALAVTGTVQARTAAAPAAPGGLKAFLLRANEPVQHEFARTPSFAWAPVHGAIRYEFELSKNQSFTEAGIFWSDEKLKTPAVSVPVALPWLTGSPYAVYARVRAITRSGVTAWSAPFGFNVRWGNLPQPTATSPGMSRWSVVDGATSYHVWFPDIRKVVGTRTNAVDHREFYAFHQSTGFAGTVRWRVRAVRNLYGKIPTGLPTVTYGPWSPMYTTTNPALADGVVTPTSSSADTTTSTTAATQEHELTPGFSFTGTQAATSVRSELYRVYVFSDADCVNVIHRGSIVASPAYVPRTTGSLALPGKTSEVALARTAFLADLKKGVVEVEQFMNDAAKVTSTESDKEPAKPAGATPAATPGTTKTGATPTTPSSDPDPASTPPENDLSLPATPAVTGAPVDLWDSGWPNGRFYWTVVPVGFEVASPKATVVTSAVSSGGTVFRVGSVEGFVVGDLARVGSGSTQETLTVTIVDSTALTVTTTPANFAHGAGETILSLASVLQYWDQELPQDNCAAGRVQSFGKGSKPLVASSGSPFVSGLSPRGLLTTAAGSVPSFYGTPLAAWQPALGADQYQVQWSKTKYPWAKEGEKLTYATSALLPLGPGKWFYRVRGLNFSLPGTARAMSWSAPAGLTVSKPTFTVVKKSGR